MKRLLLATFLALLLCGAGASGKTKPKPKIVPDLPFVFEAAEGNTLIEPGDADASTPGTEAAFAGKLLDTGEINIFYKFKYDPATFRTSYQMYYVPKRKLKVAGGEVWAKVFGRFIESREMRPALELDEYQPAGPDFDKMRVDGKPVCETVRKHLREFDANDYKKTKRFKESALAKRYGKKDLNQALFRKSDDVVFYDFDAQVAGFDCGKRILGEGSNYGDFLTYMAVFDVGKGTLIKVLVVNTGYFLE